MSLEAMSEVLGSGYSIMNDGMESVVLSNAHLAQQEVDLTNAYVEPETTQDESKIQRNPRDEVGARLQRPPKTFDDYVFQFYIGSLTVVGLFVFFRMMQRSR